MGNDKYDWNVLDLLIKYGAVLGVIAYVVGLSVEKHFLDRLDLARDLPLGNPAHIFTGCALLGFIVSVILTGLLLSRFQARLPRLGSLALSVVLGVFVFLVIFSITVWGFHAWIRDGLFAATPAAFLCGIGVFVGGSNRRLPDVMVQVFFVFTVLTLLIAYGAGWGQVRARYALGSQHFHASQLLVAGDAVSGAREMGLAFPGWRAGDNSAHLSGEVDVVYEGERAYVLRVNGRLMHLNKDKVLGSIP
jgi:hypothetical protein